MEMLSEHTLEGWLEGYVLTGRHGFLSTYEAFVHVIDSMFNQHAKWLENAKHELDWRAPVPSINILITSLVWRQDHNGFTHQDPGFLDVVTNKSPDVFVSICRRMPTVCSVWRTIVCVRRLHECDRRGQAEPPPVPQHGRCRNPLYKGHWHLGLGFHG